MGKIKGVILGISIAVIFAFFIGFGISAFYEAPEYEDYCESKILRQEILTQEKCAEAGGEWSYYDNREIERPIKISSNEYICRKGTVNAQGEFIFNCETFEPEQKEGYCDIYAKCSKEYDDANKGYSRNIFIIASIIGILTMVIGSFVLKQELVSPGLMGGGFITILYGVIRYWQYAGDKLRFIILGIILAMLIYLAYRKFPFAGKKK